MTAITIADLTNAKTDVDHIAAIATSTALTATDRIGGVKSTLSAAIDSIKSFNNRGAWVTATVYAGKDLVSNAGTWYVCVVAHTSSAAFSTDTASKWRVYQGLIAGDLAASSGSSLVGYLPAGTGAVVTTVQDKLRESVTLYDHMTEVQRTDVLARTSLVSVTTPVQSAIDDAILRGKQLTDITGGTFLVSTLDFNGTGHATPVNNEYAGVQSFSGGGRFNSTVFKAAAGYVAGTYVISGKNLSGKHYRNFSVNGNGSATNGIDFSWVGGSSGNPTIAPSNNNVFENIVVEGCSDLGINFDQCHDSKISGIWVKGVGVEGIAMSLQGAGGQLVIDNVWCSSGIFRVSCQNAGISNCGFFGGVQLTGSGYNVVTWTGVHFYQRASNGLIINNDSIGNATLSNSFNGCYFNSCTHLLNGQWYQGATFTNCKFATWSSFADPVNFTPASGSGQLPVFKFEACSFDGSTPTAVAGKYNVIVIGCKNSLGQIVTDYGNIITSAPLISSNQIQLSGVAKIVSGEATLNTSATLTIPLVTGTGFMTVMNYNPLAANQRTSTTYHVGTYQGDGAVLTVIATSVGSNPGGAPFTASISGTNVVLTNTFASQTVMKAAIMYVGV